MTVLVPFYSPQMPIGSSLSSQLPARSILSSASTHCIHHPLSSVHCVNWFLLSISSPLCVPIRSILSFSGSVSSAHEIRLPLLTVQFDLMSDGSFHTSLAHLVIWWLLTLGSNIKCQLVSSSPLAPSPPQKLCTRSSSPPYLPTWSILSSPALWVDCHLLIFPLGYFVIVCLMAFSLAPHLSPWSFYACWQLSHLFTCPLYPSSPHLPIGSILSSSTAHWHLANLLICPLGPSSLGPSSPAHWVNHPSSYVHWVKPLLLTVPLVHLMFNETWLTSSSAHWVVLHPPPTHIWLFDVRCLLPHLLSCPLGQSSSLDLPSWSIPSKFFILPSSSFSLGHLMSDRSYLTSSSHPQWVDPPLLTFP